MILIYEIDLDTPKMYLHATIKFLGQGFQRLESERVRQTDDKIVRVGKKSGPGLSRLWTKVHEINRIVYVHLLELSRSLLIFKRMRYASFAGLDQQSYSTLGPVSTVMGDRSGVQLPMPDTYLTKLIQPATQVNSAWPSLRE